MTHRLASFVVVLLSLTGCSGMLADLAGAPPSLYELTAPEGLAPEAKVVKSQVLLDIPLSSAGIDTPRIALINADGTMAYFKDITWTDRAPVMYQTLLVNAFDRSGKLPAVGRENVGLRADYLIKTDLAALQVEYDKAGVPVANVSLNAKLISMPRRIIISGGSFSAKIPAESDTIPALRKALQQASDQAVGQLVSWTLTELDKRPVTR